MNKNKDYFWYWWWPIVLSMFVLLFWAMSLPECSAKNMVTIAQIGNAYDYSMRQRVMFDDGTLGFVHAPMLGAKVCR